MFNKLKVFALSGAVAAAASVAAAAPTGVAHAAAYNGACGSGYSVIDSLGLSNAGAVYLSLNNSAGKICAVTIRNTPGTGPMGAEIRLPGEVISEHGSYRLYAGPVYAPLPAEGCLEWGGWIGNVSAWKMFCV